MEIALGVIALLALLIVFGKLKGPPTPGAMTDEDILSRIQSENDWIRRYQALPESNRTGLTAQHESKQKYIMELMLELNNRHEPKKQESLAPVIQRTFELVRQGKSEEDAQKQALAEYISARDARQGGPAGGANP